MIKLDPHIQLNFEILFDFMKLNQQLSKADLILVLCSNILFVADHATELYKLGLAAKILFAGGVTNKNNGYTLVHFGENQNQLCSKTGL